MGKEKCADEEHEWMCAQSGGTVGEIIKTRKLSPQEVDLVRSDSRQASIVCPNGIIICDRCDQRLIKEQEERNATSDVDNLERRLVE